MAEQKKAAPKKRPAHRPSGYRKDFAKQAEKLCRLGATDKEVADFLEVDVATVYRWKHRYPEFCDALKSGKVYADERVERSLYQKATGFEYVEQQAIKVKVSSQEEKIEVVDVIRHSPTDTTAAIFWLKNRRPAEWRDRREMDVTIRDEDRSDADILAELEALEQGEPSKRPH